MPPRGLAEKKKDKKKKVNFKEVEKKKTYSTKIPVSDYLESISGLLPVYFWFYILIGMLVKGVMFKHLKVNVYELNQNKKSVKYDLTVAFQKSWPSGFKLVIFHDFNSSWTGYHQTFVNKR